MPFYASPNRNVNGEEGIMTFNCSKDGGTVATDEESPYSSYQSSNSSNGTDGAHSQCNDDNHKFTRYEQILEESSCTSGEVSCTSGEYTTNTSSDESSGWDSDLENLMTWMNDTIIHPQSKVLPWIRAQVDGTDRRRPASPHAPPAASPEVGHEVAAAAAASMMKELPSTGDYDCGEADQNGESKDDLHRNKMTIHEDYKRKAETSSSGDKTGSTPTTLSYRAQQYSKGVSTAGQAASVLQHNREEYDESSYDESGSDYSESDESYGSEEQILEIQKGISQEYEAFPAADRGAAVHQGESIASAIHVEQSIGIEPIKQLSPAPPVAEMGLGQIKALRYVVASEQITSYDDYASSEDDEESEGSDDNDDSGSEEQILEGQNGMSQEYEAFPAADRGAAVHQGESVASAIHVEQSIGIEPIKQLSPAPPVAGKGLGQIKALRYVVASEQNTSNDDYSSCEDDEDSEDSDYSYGSTWSIEDSYLDEHKKFVDGELAKKHDYGGWKSLSSTHSASSSLSDLSVTRDSGMQGSKDRTPAPPREVSSSAPPSRIPRYEPMLAKTALAYTSRASSEMKNPMISPRPSQRSGARRFSMGRQQDRQEGENVMGRASLGSISTGAYTGKQFSETKKSEKLTMADMMPKANGFTQGSKDEALEDTHADDSSGFSFHRELLDPVDFEDISDPQLKKLSEKLYKKVNQDPWDEFNKYRDDDVCDFIRLHPETCKVRYVFEHFSSKLFPLSMLSTLGASRHTMELAYEAYEDAVHEKDICIGTPLHYAAAYKAKPSVVEFLSEVEPSMLKSINQFGRAPLHMACLFKAPSKTVTFLLNEHPFAAETADKDGYTPLHLACEHGANNEVIRRLVTANPSVCLSLTTRSESTPLHLACSYGASRATTRALVQANPDAAGYQDVDGKTPLHLAAQTNAPLAIIEMLVKASPESVNTKSDRGQTALKIAKQRKAVFAIQKLLSA
jgi:ankyrin repeat protein